MDHLIPIIIWTVLCLVPLIPIYIGFDVLDSSASFHNIARGTKLGGAIAAYFVLWTTGAVMYNQLVKPPEDPTVLIKEQVVGEWACDAIIYDESHEYNDPIIYDGSMYIDLVNKNKLNINGRTAKKIWTANVTLMDESKMIIIFEIPVTTATGVSILRFQRNDDGIIHSMFGFWGLTGTNGKGSVECKRPTRERAR